MNLNWGRALSVHCVNRIDEIGAGKFSIEDFAAELQTLPANPYGVNRENFIHATLSLARQVAEHQKKGW